MRPIGRLLACILLVAAATALLVTLLALLAAPAVSTFSQLVDATF